MQKQQTTTEDDPHAESEEPTTDNTPKPRIKRRLPNDPDKLKEIIKKQRDRYKSRRETARERYDTMKAERDAIQEDRDQLKQQLKEATKMAKDAGENTDRVAELEAELEELKGKYESVETELQGFRDAEETERQTVLKGIPEEDREGLEDLPLAKLKIISERFISTERKEQPSQGQEEPVEEVPEEKPKTLGEAMRKRYANIDNI